MASSSKAHENTGGGDGRDSPLERYVSVLETIAVASGALSLSDIAKRCELPHGTTHRLVNTLLNTGMLRRATEGGRDYTLGPRLLRLLHFGTDLANIRIVAQPLLNEIADRMGSTCFLVRMSDGLAIQSIAWAVPDRGLRGYVVPGHDMPAHAAASAKAILAFQSQAVIDKVLREPLSKLAPETKTNREDVLADYARVRENGYATCLGEWETALGAIACPVHLPQLGVLYSIGISGFITELERHPVNDVVSVLTEAANKLARRLPVVQRDEVLAEASAGPAMITGAVTSIGG